MNFNEYQEHCLKTMNFWGSEAEIISNMSMGIAGEAGEIVNYIKKGVYQGHSLDKDKIKEEIGDTIWYLSALASRFDIPLEDIVKFNIEKLNKRYPDGFSKEKSVNRED